jgi:osmotically-inducible protein OsmY
LSGTATVPDNQIESQVRQSLAQQNIDISSVTITVNAGVVNLSGQAASQAEADRIAAAVRSVNGVKQVQNNLTVKH